MEWFEGFHGTDSRLFPSIKASNFRPSKSPGDWLGKGVYFFTEGIGDPLEHAKGWAIKLGVDRRRGYKSYSVIQARAGAGKVLDLRTVDDLNKFDALRAEVTKKFLENAHQGKDYVNLDDQIFDVAAEMLEIEIVVSHLYMKNKDQAQNNIGSRINNVTVMNVMNVDCINIDSIREVESGEVK